MTINRPYNAEDNDLNKLQAKILTDWAKKNEDTIVEMTIFAKAVRIETQNGYTVKMNISEGCMSRYQNVREHLYMSKMVGNRWVRIKKSEW